MLRKELEEMKKEYQEVLISRRGGCKFCGQIADIETPESWTDEIVDEAVTEGCGCIKAMIYTRKKGQKERAVDAIEKNFGPEAEQDQVKDEVKKLLIDIAYMVVEGDINSGTIDIGNGIKAKISMTAKGYVKVERTKTEKTTQEA